MQPPGTFPIDARIGSLLRLRDLAGAVAQIDLNAADNSEAVALSSARELRALLRDTLAVMGTLQSDEPVEEGELELDAWAPRASRPPSLSDVCFAGVLELRGVTRVLEAATNPADRLVAIDTARRKLRRAIRAALEIARVTDVADVIGGAHQGHHQVSDVASGIAVRKLYAVFRRSLHAVESSTADDVMVAMRYAVGALARLVSEPDYADVRAQDRTVMRSLRERALRWAREDRSSTVGLQILADIWACVDLMRGINRRQEIRQHDATLIAELLLSPPIDVGRFEPLFGLDDELDELIVALRTRHDQALVAIALERLRQLKP